MEEIRDWGYKHYRIQVWKCAGVGWAISFSTITGTSIIVEHSFREAIYRADHIARNQKAYGRIAPENASNGEREHVSPFVD